VRAFTAAAIGYTALVVVLTWPLLLHLSSVLPHDLGDPLLSTSILWWNAHVTPLTVEWWNGFAFFPAEGTLAFSDHRLGESLLATPLQWLGLSAVSAYNLTLLATFPLSAAAAYGLGYTLTSRHDAAFLCGLAYGYSPFRIAHIEHLELLAAFGMPAALAALHSYVATGRRQWLAAYGIVLVLQALCATYYALLFSVLLALWMLWFLRWPDRRLVFGIAAASASALLAIAPLAVGYWRIHTRDGLSRTLLEIQTYSADLSSFVTASPLSRLWGWTAAWNGPERQLFPGLTVVVVVAAGLLATRRAPRPWPRPARVAAAWLAGCAVVFLLAAASALWIGAWSASLGPMHLSTRDAFKPLTLSLVAVAAALACHPAFQRAYRRRSPFAFYVLAAVAMLIFSLGPTPSFRGAQFLYKPPYAWLMTLPIFEGGVRAPARFAMPAILALSAAAALAFARLSAATPRTAVAATIVAVAIIADGWTRPLPLRAVPERLPALDAGDARAMLTLPFGDAEEEAAAMFRALRAGYASVNGLSGYDPRHYSILRLALIEGDGSPLDVLAERGALLVALDTRADAKGGWLRFLSARPDIVQVGGDQRWVWFRIPRRAAAADSAAEPMLPLVAVRDERGAIVGAALNDGDPSTGWFRTDVQFPGETLLLELRRPARVSALEMSLGANGETFPRRLAIAASADGQTWQTAFLGPTGGLAFRAALASPRDVRLRFALAPTTARFIRLRIEQAALTPLPWFVTDVVVRGVSEPTPG
jgi:hypothetical protein